MEPDTIRLKPIKPVLSGYIRDAQIMLKSEGVPDEKTVHDVRVLMKKARALLRLIKPQIDADSYNKNYTDLRDTGRMMRSWREASVLRKMLKEIRKKHPSLMLQLSENEVINGLLKKEEMLPGQSAEMTNDLEKINSMLNKSAFRIRFQSINNLNAHLLLKELENTYLIVVDNYLICRNNPKPENLHKFRKRSKDFLYQLYSFRSLNPARIKSIEKKIDVMTQNLGRYNDLAQLIKVLDYKYRKESNTPALDELILIIKGMQDSYLSKVWPSAYKFFCPGQNFVNVLGYKLLVI